MSDDAPAVEGIDHVELTVPDRSEAAAWYEDVLGLAVVDDLEGWAASPSNPLMVSADGGRTMLALFRGDPGSDDGGPFHRVAFRVDGRGFLALVDRLAARGDVEVGGPGAVVDHDRSFSVYFADPWGHPLEVTTYDYEHVAGELGGG